MRQTIARLFGRSPFAPLRSHMKKVSICLKKLTLIFENFESIPPQELLQMVEALSKLEHEADLTKNDIRNHLPKSLFLPIDRSQLLEILSIQDSLSDKAEEIGHLLLLHPLQRFPTLFTDLQSLFKHNIKAFWDVRDVIKELYELFASSFGGIETEKIKVAVEKTSYIEYQADKMKHQLMRQFFAAKDPFPPPYFTSIHVF